MWVWIVLKILILKSGVGSGFEILNFLMKKSECIFEYIILFNFFILKLILL